MIDLDFMSKEHRKDLFHALFVIDFLCKKYPQLHEIIINSDKGGAV